VAFCDAPLTGSCVACQLDAGASLEGTNANGYCFSLARSNIEKDSLLNRRGSFEYSRMYPDSLGSRLAATFALPPQISEEALLTFGVLAKCALNELLTRNAVRTTLGEDAFGNHAIPSSSTVAERWADVMFRTTASQNCEVVPKSARI
jgi:hypothetical protein